MAQNSQVTFLKAESYQMPLVRFELEPSPLSLVLSPNSRMWTVRRNKKLQNSDGEGGRWDSRLHFPGFRNGCCLRMLTVFLSVCFVCFYKGHFCQSHITKEKAKTGKTMIICHKRSFLFLCPGCMNLC